MKSQLEKSDTAIVDLQCRSMRDNLIFVGIEEPEYVPDEPEDVENSLHSVLRKEMNITEKIPFHRVHRIGRYERLENTPRPIVAKFERFKDREFVRSAAQTLKGKPFGVREQFPKVSEDRRKQLHPIMKTARANEENKVRLVRDRLYINSCQYVSDSVDENEQPAPRKQANYQTANRRQNQNTLSFRANCDQHQTYKSRVFQRSKSDRNVHFPMQQTSKKLSFSGPMASNTHSDSNTEMERIYSRKHKASSPLDSMTTKKYREHKGSEPDKHDTCSRDTYLTKFPEIDMVNRT